MAGAGAGQGSSAADRRRIKQLESELELERSLREGAEKQAAAYKKRLAGRMQQEDLLSVSVKAVARNIRSYSAAQITALPDDLRQRVRDELLAEGLDEQVVGGLFVGQPLTKL